MKMVNLKRVKGAYLREQFALKGVCVSLGKEVWWIENGRLKIGEVIAISSGKNVTVKTNHGTEILDPQDSLMLAKPGEK